MFGLFGRNKSKDRQQIEEMATAIGNGIFDKLVVGDNDGVRFDEVAAFSAAVTFKSYIDRYGKKAVVTLDDLCRCQYLVASFGLQDMSLVEIDINADPFTGATADKIMPLARKAVKAYLDALQMGDPTVVSNMLYTRSESIARPGILDIRSLLQQAMV